MKVPLVHWKSAMPLVAGATAAEETVEAGPLVAVVGEEVLLSRVKIAIL